MLKTLENIAFEISQIRKHIFTNLSANSNMRPKTLPQRSYPSAPTPLGEVRKLGRCLLCKINENIEVKLILSTPCHGLAMQPVRKYGF